MEPDNYINKTPIFIIDALKTSIKFINDKINQNPSDDISKAFYYLSILYLRNEIYERFLNSSYNENIISFYNSLNELLEILKVGNNSNNNGNNTNNINKFSRKSVDKADLNNQHINSVCFETINLFVEFSNVTDNILEAYINKNINDLEIVDRVNKFVISLYDSVLDVLVKEKTINTKFKNFISNNIREEFDIPTEKEIEVARNYI
ncbi:MAG: hypothetical protein M1538_00885 [Candidatus Marsarchaeota archaeon]|nr:hypothetical protein [Candidatus Marsarchaeota archaeon]